MKRLSATIAASLASVVLLAGCASTPTPLRGEFASLTPTEASRSNASGERVRWGGTIVGVDPREDATCFEVLGRPLADSARPRKTDVGTGRFLACRAGFYDPAIFADGRELTVIGTLSGSETRPVGAYRYAYPRVDADVVFLWPEREDRDVYYVGTLGMYHRPYWGGYYLRPYHPVRVVRPRGKDE
jgi:outer membrane lipoprotein